MHPCPCCGYRTLPERGAYDLCPVCWWEDDGAEPWEYSGPNAQTLIEGQQEYLALRRPYLLRPKVRAPKRKEARDPDWQPFDLSDEVVQRMKREKERDRREWEDMERQADREFADDPEGPFKAYNSAVESPRTEVALLSHREVEVRLRDVGIEHGLQFPDPQLELLARLLKDENYYRGHPVRTAWWLLRYSRPTTFKQRWAEVRTGAVHVAG